MDEMQNQNQMPQGPQMPPAQQVSNSTLMAILAYFGILIIIPILVAKNDSFVKFHIKQGLALLITAIVLWILFFPASIFLAALRIPLIGLFFPLIWLLVFLFFIIGVINAATGKTKELPLIGGFGSKFNF